MDDVDTREPMLERDALLMGGASIFARLSITQLDEQRFAFVARGWDPTPR